jgi:hypothetical protein
LKNRTAAKIADETITIGQHFGGVKDNLIFWYSQNKDRVYVYDLRTSGTYHELWLVSNLPESEEALSFTFPFTSWRLVDGEQFFTFSSTETGEVFSDGSTESLESFLSEFNLTDYLDEEKLSEIGLSGV